MSIEIKLMESDSEIEGKAYVHFKAWHETYEGLVDESYLDKITLKKCVEIAYENLGFNKRGNIFVAKDEGKVIGFIGYGPYRDDSMPTTSEIYSLYVLREYYGKKVSYALMKAALHELSDYSKVALWVLKSNARAIRFYEKCGFKFDGTEKAIVLGRQNIEIRMILPLIC